MEWNEQKMEEAMDAIWERAGKDKDFRNLCLSNSQEAIKQASGIEVPESYKIKFVEPDPAYNETWALPVFKEDAGELSEGELDMAAGGKNDTGARYRRSQ